MYPALCLTLDRLNRSILTAVLNQQTVNRLPERNASSTALRPSMIRPSSCAAAPSVSAAARYSALLSYFCFRNSPPAACPCLPWISVRSLPMRSFLHRSLLLCLFRYYRHAAPVCADSGPALFFLISSLFLLSAFSMRPPL